MSEKQSWSAKRLPLRPTVAFCFFRIDSYFCYAIIIFVSYQNNKGAVTHNSRKR